MVSPTVPSTQNARPEFLDQLSGAYYTRAKSVVLLTGNTHDLFSCPKLGKFLELEQVLYQELCDKFAVARLDISGGIDFYDNRDLTGLVRVCAQLDTARPDPNDKLGDLKSQVSKTRFEPLSALVLLRDMFTAITEARLIDRAVKPLCTIVQFTGSLFPAGDFNQLGELDRQRLVTFLNMIESPRFKNSYNLIVLIADTRVEVNGRIIGLPSAQSIEIEMPNESERARFVNAMIGDGSGGKPKVEFENGVEQFAGDTAGLTLTAIQDLMECARRSGKKVTRKDVVAEINLVLQADLGDIIKISRPEHGPADVVGYAQTLEIFTEILRRCENRSTAVPAVLVSGPNGSGKTYQVEACASGSGRVVIELTGLRGKWFGDTDKFFEKLRLRLRSYGKILIIVDEAHAQFGSVHDSDTHETEKRLAANVIKMMGDRTMFGKVLWVLMTSRPDELDPDVKRRSPIMVPIFDLEGADRQAFVVELFNRSGLTIPEEEIAEVMQRTERYSASDYSFFATEMRSSGRTSAIETLDNWQATTSIVMHRRFQTLIAAEHCSYPRLLPALLRERIDTEEMQREIETLKHRLHR